MKTGILAQRTMSSYPISIGTALALESIAIGPNEVYDAEREIPMAVALSTYDQAWFHLYTLFRNVIGAIPSSELMNVSAREIAFVMIDEIELISEIISKHSSATTCVFYSSDYADLIKTYPMAMLRTDNTALQKFKTQLMVETIRLVYRGMGKDERLKHFHLKIQPEKRVRALVMTGYAHDLTCAQAFEHLDLLESHTGLLKDKALWYTKYYRGSELIRIPFCLGLLQVFGDSTLFSPHARILREDVLALANKYNWSFATTRDRIMLSISSMENVSHREMLRDMFSR